MNEKERQLLDKLDSIGIHKFETLSKEERDMFFDLQERDEIYVFTDDFANIEGFEVIDTTASDAQGAGEGE